MAIFADTGGNIPGYSLGTAADTAGNPFVAADGAVLTQQDPATQQSFVAAHGANAARVWAQQYNTGLIVSGRAIQTPQGVVSIDNAQFVLNKAGYNGPQDPSSIASHYQMLATPPPAAPAPQASAAASAALSGLSLGVGGVPKPLIYAGLAFVAYEMFFKRGHR